MKLKFFIIALGLLVGACKKTDSTGAIVLTGEQNTPLTLTNRFNSLTTADYIVEGQFRILASVTIEPGTVILMKPGSEIVIDGSGSLKAIGTSDLPIRFSGETPSSGSWNKLLFLSNSPNNILDHVIIEHGGGDNSYDGSVYGYNSGRLSMRNTLIRNGKNYGLRIYTDEFTLVEFTNNTIHNVQHAPVRVRPVHWDKFDLSLTAYGNGFNRIEIESGVVSLPKTIHPAVIPYFVPSGQIEINQAVEFLPGVTTLMGPQAVLAIFSAGSLKAIGTFENPIVFTGEQSVNGYWNGIRFLGSNNLNNEFQHCTIAYGGGDASWNGIVYLYDNARFKLGNSRVQYSQTYGIINYGNNNTFVNDGNNVFEGNLLGDIGN